MRISTKGMLAIAHFEAAVTTRYRDSRNIWTIGIGATHAALKDTKYDPETFTGTLTIEEVFALFRDTLIPYERKVNMAIERPAEQHEFDAMVSFHYNTGAITRASWVNLWNNGASPDDIAKSFMQWSKPPEIIHRRRQEKNLLLHGEYPPGDVSLYTADEKGHIRWHHGKVLRAERAIALLEGTGHATA